MDGCWLNLGLHGFNGGVAINKQTHLCFFRHFISIRDKDVTKIMLVILKLRRKKMRPTVRPKEPIFNQKYLIQILINIVNALFSFY